MNVEFEDILFIAILIIIFIPIIYINIKRLYYLRQDLFLDAYKTSDFEIVKNDFYYLTYSFKTNEDLGNYVRVGRVVYKKMPIQKLNQNFYLYSSVRYY